jgi:predicted Ser/Thr protein kinase
MPDAAELARVFPQLEIGECLGRGGMGVVYRARQRSLDRVVALKLLAPERGQDASFAARFAREAQALAKLNHPHIVTIHDFGQAGGYYYLLMEYVDGVNLRQAMRAGRFTPEQALAIVPPVCEALHYAHTQGLVHRDIKPENLLLDRDGRIKIADFGIAKMMDDGEADRTGIEESQPAGTPRYMAPEQRDAARRTDHRADIYSLGVVLYELLTGEVPGDRLEPPSRRVQIDVRLDEIVLRALEAAPERRYQTAVEMRTRLEELGAPAPAAAADGSSTPTAATPSGILRAGRATVTTPEQLGTAAGQFFHFRDNRHELVLEAARLTLAGGRDAVVIPLAAIRDLSLGRFPRTVNPAGLDFISITYDQGSEQRRLIVAPFDGLFGSPSQFNSHVHAWWTAIRDAAQAATGRAPALTPPSQLGTPGSSTWLTVALLAPVVIGLGLGLVLLDSAAGSGISRPRPPGVPGLVPVVLLICAALSPLFGTPVRRGGGEAAWVGPAVGIGAAALAVFMLLGRPSPLEGLLLLAATLGSIAWFKWRASARATGLVEAPPPSRAAKGLAYGAAIGLTVLFAAPHFSVLGAGNVETWTVGLPKPWITDIKHTFPGGGGQRIREMQMDRPSFFCGFGALAAWMLWLRLRAWRTGTADFDFVEAPIIPGERPRVRWAQLAIVWSAVACLSVIALLLTCVFMAHLLGDFPAPMPLLVMAVIPVSMLVLNSLRLGLRQARGERHQEKNSVRAPWHRGCLAAVALLGLVALAVLAIMTAVWVASRQPKPPVTTPQPVPASEARPTTSESPAIPPP